MGGHPVAETTAERVLAIMTETVPDDYDMSLQLADTSELVEELCGGSGYTDSRMETIKRWLTAHFVSIDIAQVQQDNISRLQSTVFGKVGLAFDQTRYGQQAKLFDTKGNLAALENGQEIIKKFPVGVDGLLYLGRPKKIPRYIPPV